MGNISRGRRPDGWPRGSSRPASSSLLLDLVSGAVAGYGLRKLRNAYVGKAVNIRRSSDNATQDIGFAGNNFDVAGFSAFVGGGTGFVVTWYDQVGSANATQATQANQPSVALGATPSGKAAVLAASTSIVLTATIPAATIPLAFAAMMERTGALGAIDLAMSLGASSPCLFFDTAANIGIGNTSVDGLVGSGAADNAFHSAIGIENGASSSITIDGTGTTGTISNHAGSTSLYLFSSNLSFGVIGDLAEAIYFGVAPSASDIATIHTNHRTYYGTP